MSDLKVTCIERACGQEFTVTEGEQQFYASKDYTLPKRCKACRQARKAQKDGGTSTPSFEPQPDAQRLMGSSRDDAGNRRRGDSRGNDRRRQRRDW